MKDVLKNLAHIYLLEYTAGCGIDCSGSYVVKHGRGYRYDLVDLNTKKPFASVTFTKHSTPSYTLWDGGRRD